tara:strand:- start:5177 stop:5374 length:198 start_codon:yes stop_codon:yes gene_type:complete
MSGVALVAAGLMMLLKVFGRRKRSWLTKIEKIDQLILKSEKIRILPYAMRGLWLSMRCCDVGVES